MKYICEVTGAIYKNEQTCKNHEATAKRAESLADIINCTVKDGWKPPPLTDIKAWAWGDKIELLRLFMLYQNKK